MQLADFIFIIVVIRPINRFFYAYNHKRSCVNQWKSISNWKQYRPIFLRLSGWQITWNHQKSLNTKQAWLQCVYTTNVHYKSPTLPVFCLTGVVGWPPRSRVRPGGAWGGRVPTIALKFVGKAIVVHGSSSATAAWWRFLRDVDDEADTNFCVINLHKHITHELFNTSFYLLIVYVLDCNGFKNQTSGVLYHSTIPRTKCICVVQLKFK